MKTLYRIILLAILCNCFNSSSAQYITLPDSNFVTWLNQNGFSACLNGNQMDTTCNSITSAKIISAEFVGFTDLEGIQYFDSLITLACSLNPIFHLPAFPPLIENVYLQLSKLTSLPPLPASLSNLICHNSELTSLPVLPQSLRQLGVGSNRLNTIPVLPDSLERLYVSNNNISSLVTLPPCLKELYISNNPITNLDTLPNGLLVFEAANVFNNSFPFVPTSVIELNCGNNGLTALQPLPPGLVKLNCENNNLGILPVLPVSLTTLVCYHSQLTSLPALPASLRDLRCDRNKLTRIPELPDTLDFFNCSRNPNLDCLPRLGVINTFIFNNTAITCLPNYPTDNYTSTPAFSSLPICDTAFINNCNLSTQISEVDRAPSDYSIYPNPTQQQFTVTTTQPNQTLQIFDIEGRIVFTQNINGTATTINISNMASGVYVVGVQ
jgi:hypothetical protein